MVVNRVPCTIDHENAYILIHPFRIPDTGTYCSTYHSKRVQCTHNIAHSCHLPSMTTRLVTMTHDAAKPTTSSPPSAASVQKLIGNYAKSTGNGLSVDWISEQSGKGHGLGAPFIIYESRI